MQLFFTGDATILSYWLNWRVLLCVTWVLTSMVIASCMIRKYEGLGDLKSNNRKSQQKTARSLYNDDTWRPCLKEIHPAWLLVFRVIAFCLLLATLIVKIIFSGGHIFYYYTQWTFTLVTIYFGFGSLLSIYGCYRYQKISSKETDAEQGYYMPLNSGESTNIIEIRKVSSPQEDIDEAAGIFSYLFEVIFQMNAGAVMLTDCVYWFIIFPFLTIADYNLNLMTVNMHSLNAVLLLGDAALNCLRTPWFRISYFILWTGIFVIFQWIAHACGLVWWPYPFLDLSAKYAPLWYFLVGLMHIPCYGIFALLVELKHYLLSKWFPQSYQC